MNKLCGLSIVVIIFLTTSAAMGTITYTSAYFSADAQVESNLYGPDVKHNEGVSPVDASAAVGGDSGSAAAQSFSNLLSVSGWSAVNSAPGHIGAAVGTSGSMMLEIIADESWELDVQTIYSLDFSANAYSGITSAKALVSDLENNPIYSYDVTTDGISGSKVFGAGSYNLSLYISCYSIVSQASEVSEHANSSVGLNASISAVPEPATALLFLVGAGFVCRFKKRMTRHC